VTGAQGGDEDPFPEGLDDPPIDGTADQQAFPQTLRREGRQPGDSLAPSARNPSMRPLATGGSCPQRRQRRGSTGFIKKDELRRIDIGHRRAPGGAGNLVACGGDQALVLRRRPSLASSPLRCEGLRETPETAARRKVGQGGIGVRRDKYAQLLIASWSQFRPPPGARLLGQLLAPAMPCQPPKHGASIDTKQWCRFTSGQPGVKGRHQALAEVGRRAQSHAPS
jgi:hypothetical protein